MYSQEPLHTTCPIKQKVQCVKWCPSLDRQGSAQEQVVIAGGEHCLSFLARRQGHSQRLVGRVGHAGPVTDLQVVQSQGQTQVVSASAAGLVSVYDVQWNEESEGCPLDVT